jgi:hypothetical protein
MKIGGLTPGMMAGVVSAALLLPVAPRLEAAGTEPDNLGSAVTNGSAVIDQSTLTNSSAPERWSSFLPLMADEARKQGHDLPLPFGVSAIYNHIERDIKVNDLRIGLNGAPPQSVSRFVNLGSTSKVDAAVGRADAWLLPFLDVYGLLGYLRNQSVTEGVVTISTPIPRTFSFSGETSMEGVVAGGGMTLATGFREFFLMADANVSQTDIGFDDAFSALIVSVRTGWNGKIGKVPARLWVGGMYWDTDNTARSTVNVPGTGTVSFEADQGPAHPWNASVGTSFALSKQWEGMLEYGFNFDDVHIFAAGMTFRF